MNLLNNNQIEKITVSLVDIKNRQEKARRIFNFAVKNLSGAGDEDIIYTNLYDSIRMGCEVILWLFGYRVKKSSEGHHYLTINAAGELLSGEMSNEFQRIQKMRQKRNRFDYGNLASISEVELKQALTDAKSLLNRAEELIKGRDKEN
ncbi:MAG: hypothetical protein WC545_04070 [Patescibacteria group bacterium]